MNVVRCRACNRRLETDIAALAASGSEALTAEELARRDRGALRHRVSLACSFQKEESRPARHAASRVEPKARVFAIDTHYLFPETYELWREVERRYDTKIEVFEGPSAEELTATHGEKLWERKPDLYLAVAKVEPLVRALGDLDCWITGIRRDQSPTRANAPKLGWDAAHELWKANPLADWSDDDCWTYIRERGLPYNALHDRGYASIGDTHSTLPGAGREGRWAGSDRTECGLHPTERRVIAGARPPLPPRRARGGGDPHHARARGRARAAGAALLRRQGLDRAPAARGEGVPAGQVPVPGHARRHRPQLPRGDRVPRPARRRARRDAARRVGAGVDRQRPRRRGDRAARVAEPAPDDDAARRDRGAPLRRRDRRRAPRRGARPREGADLQLPRRLRPVEPARAAARAVEPLQRPRPPRRARARLPDLELDRARRLAVHRPRGPRAAVDLLRARARGVPPRRDALRGQRVRRADGRRGSVHRLGAVPHRRRHELHRRGRARTRSSLEEVVAEIAATRVTERGETRADDRASEAAMEDRKRVGYF